MKRTKHFLVAILGLAMFVTLCAGCHKNNNINIKEETSYLAGGTIPESAKIYPIVNDDMQMTLNDSRLLVTQEDIWTLTHYVDIWSTIDDTRNDGMDEDSLEEFVPQAQLDEIIKNRQSSASDYSVDAVQILTIASISENEVEIPFVKEVTGCNTEKGIAEGAYQIVGSLRFKKSDEKWALSGVSFITMEKKGDITFYRDTITGKYSLDITAN